MYTLICVQVATVPIQLLVNEWPGEIAEDGPRPWALAPTWKTTQKLLALDFGSAQFQLLGPLGERLSR